jgi:aminopeptidase
MPVAEHLAAYAQLAVRVALNVQQGQRVFVSGYQSGVELACAPLVRLVTAEAYDAGASEVVILWGDEAVERIGAERRSERSVTDIPAWYASVFNEHALAGDALLCVDGKDPRALAGLDPARVAARADELARAWRPSDDVVARLATNWAFVTAPTPAWARGVFPGEPDDVATELLWDAVLHAVRADLPDPVAAWRTHLDDLAARVAHLNARRFRSLRAVGPGTDLDVGLAEGHVWMGGAVTAGNGVSFVPNLPTEEIFTAPHRRRVTGHVRGTQPVSIRGEVVEGWELEFQNGKVVAATAEHGEATLLRLLASDKGSSRLGEVALVAGTSPTRATGVRFEHPIFEENLACHVALGQAYGPTIQGGAAMTPEELRDRGANQSDHHVDVMWGSPEVTVSGVRSDGGLEPLLVGGQWVW